MFFNVQAIMHMSESGLSVNLRRYARYSFRTSLDKFKRGNGFNWCPMSVNPRLKKINSIESLFVKGRERCDQGPIL